MSWAFSDDAVIATVMPPASHCAAAGSPPEPDPEPESRLVSRRSPTMSATATTIAIRNGRGLRRGCWTMRSPTPPHTMGLESRVQYQRGQGGWWMTAGEEGADGFGARAREHLQRVEAHNAAVLDAVAERMLEVVRAGGVLHTFYRAGGLACVRPLFHPALLPLSGGFASSLLERSSGLAALLAAHAAAEPGELAFVFSSSGANPVPVELAQCMRRAGAEVVAVTSLPHLRRAPARAGGQLDEGADEVVNILVPPGDAAYRRDGAATAPLSSLTSVFVWNLLLARLVDRAVAAGVELPLWRSANLPGGEAHNATLVDRYRARVPML